MDDYTEDAEDIKECSNCTHIGMLGGWCRIHHKPVEEDESCDDHEWDF